MVTWLQQNTCVGDGEEMVFYTKPADESHAAAFAKEIGSTNYYGSLIDQRMANQKGATEDGIYWKWFDECKGAGDEQDKIAHHISQALATIASSPAYVMLPHGTKAKPKSFWMVDEYPILKKRGIKVIQVDPDQNNKQKDYEI